MHRPIGLLVLLLAACSAGTSSAPAKVAPIPTSEVAVEQFMKAVADSDLAKMATLWGSAKGPAAMTGRPTDYQRRIVVIQAYLRGSSFRIAGADPITSDQTKRLVNVELTRERCVKVVPFQTVKAPGTGSWFINQIDLGAAGTPGRACDDGGRSQ